MICCALGVAPTRYPAFRSWRLSPAIAAAQHVTAPIMIAATGPLEDSFPINANKMRDEVSIVAIVTPEIGLLELPTNPAIYPATAENKKPARIMITDIKSVTGTLWISLR